MQEILVNIKDYLTYNHLIAGVLLIVIVAVCINLITPRVIHVAHKKNLIIPIVSRSCHSKEVPSLGGVGFFMVYLMCIPIINMIHFGSFAGYNVIAAITILFMVGLKDDLVNTSPKVKLYGQFLASIFIVLSPDLVIHYITLAYLTKISLIIGKPLAGYLSHISRGWPIKWFWRKDVKPAYNEVTFGWGLLFALRLIILFSLYSKGEVSKLLWVNIILGTPATVGVLILTYLYGSARLKNLKGPSVDEFLENKKPPFLGQNRGF